MGDGKRCVIADLHTLYTVRLCMALQSKVKVLRIPLYTLR
jgi:hypothetical protein